MRPPGSPAELERRRRLAVRRLQAGYNVAQVAAFPGGRSQVGAALAQRLPRPRQKGVRARGGRGGRPSSRPRRKRSCGAGCTTPPANTALPRSFGRAHAWRGSSSRVWPLLNPHYLSAWLRARGLTPQKPARVPRERDPQAIARWLEWDWPRIKKRPAARERLSCSSTRAGS